VIKSKKNNEQMYSGKFEDKFIYFLPNNIQNNWCKYKDGVLV
jgi:hypothetical protein